MANVTSKIIFTFGDMELVSYSDGAFWLNSLENGDGMLIAESDINALLKGFYDRNF